MFPADILMLLLNIRYFGNENARFLQQALEVERNSFSDGHIVVPGVQALATRTLVVGFFLRKRTKASTANQCRGKPRPPRIGGICIAAFACSRDITIPRKKVRSLQLAGYELVVKKRRSTQFPTNTFPLPSRAAPGETFRGP